VQMFVSCRLDLGHVRHMLISGTLTPRVGHASSSGMVAAAETKTASRLKKIVTESVPIMVAVLYLLSG